MHIASAGSPLRGFGHRLKGGCHCCNAGQGNAVVETAESLEKILDYTGLGFAMRVMGDTVPFGALFIGRLGAEAKSSDEGDLGKDA